MPFPSGVGDVVERKTKQAGRVPIPGDPPGLSVVTAERTGPLWTQSRRSPRLKTGTAVNGAIGRGFEGDGGLLPAGRADHLEQLTASARIHPPAGPARALGGLAGLAALRGVLEPFLRVEFLLTGGEHKGLATIHTRQRLVLERHATSSLGIRYTQLRLRSTSPLCGWHPPVRWVTARSHSLCCGHPARSAHRRPVPDDRSNPRRVPGRA